MGFPMETETEALLSEHIAAVMMPMFMDRGLISLKALRLGLEQRTGLDLSGCKPHIRCRAEQAMETIMSSMVVGCGLSKLPTDKLAELRNPYVGVWQPCWSRAGCEENRKGSLYRSASSILGPVPPEKLARGRILFHWMGDQCDDCEKTWCSQGGVQSDDACWELVCLGYGIQPHTRGRLPSDSMVGGGDVLTASFSDTGIGIGQGAATRIARGQFGIGDKIVGSVSERIRQLTARCGGCERFGVCGAGKGGTRPVGTSWTPAAFVDAG